MESLSDYDYDLPEALIAQHPLEERSASRLLILNRETGYIEHKSFRDVTDILQAGDVLVLNNTRVTARRLFGKRPTGGEVEALVLHPLDEEGLYASLLKPAKRIKLGQSLNFEGGLEATYEGPGMGPIRHIRFKDADSLAERLNRFGSVPLPPYIHESLSDEERYQTVYGAYGGSAAAPTAGLHFTEEILSQLKAKGVRVHPVTLHVSIDTFAPVTATNLADHVMHGEECELPAYTADAINTCKGRIIAVGTTSVRTLESFAMSSKKAASGSQRTSIFIKPGYNFQIIDGMFTNFHMPKTTMLCMISALAGRDAVMRAYEEAVKQQYRFLSFGDSMLII